MLHRRLAPLVVSAFLALPATGVAHIRLAGEFSMTGEVTIAHAVPGEYVGEPVTRTWTFTASCPQGQCRTEQLARSRATGVDELTLDRPGGLLDHWTGKGSYFAPLMCGSRRYPLGEQVFFRIEVHITAATLMSGAPMAMSVGASYESYKRINRTPCVGALGRDAAVYTGQLVTPAPGPPAATPAPG